MERTEPATPRKRRKAREEGQVAKSAELISCTVLLAGLFAFKNAGPAIWGHLTGFTERAIAASAHGRAGQAELHSLAVDGVMQAGKAILPVLGAVLAVGFACNVAQVGMHFTPSLLQPKLNRIDPFQGIKRLVSTRGAVELLKSAAKLGIVALVGWTYVRGHLGNLEQLALGQPGQLGGQVGDLAYGMAIRMVATLTVLGAVDYWFQRTQFEKMLRMTKQEVKDEMRDSEGNPEIKYRIKQRQREFARRRMMADVPKAAVVIMNPTHFAMALKYELGQKGAPTVVAKGRDLIALKIREVAEEHGVPVVENPPLARSLYELAEIGDEIPTSLYRAVAEVLAVVWRLNRAAEAR